MPDCGRFQRQCNEMSAGWFGASCITWAGSMTAACRECQQQARSLENQCNEQAYEDSRFDFQQVVLTENFKEIGKWVGIGLLFALLAFLIFRN